MTATAVVGRPGHGRWSKTVYALVTYALLAHLLIGLLRPQEPDGSDVRPGQQDLVAPMAALAGAYPLEEHFVTTADGYILRMFRIPHGLPNGAASSAAAMSLVARPPADAACAASAAENATVTGGVTCPADVRQARHHCRQTHKRDGSRVGLAPRPVAFMQHALMDSSAGWLLLGPGRALALQLADAGFDVWLANSRGNRYSRNHTSLDPDVDAAFWRFTWSDMADYDVPAMVGHVADVTGQQRVVYFGYSQGSMIGLAALASQPALARRISLAVLMAPVAFTRHMTSLPFVLSVKARLDERLLAAGWGEWGAYSPRFSARSMRGCRLLPGLCERYLTSLCGANPRGNLAPEIIELVMGHLPVGTSVMNMALWSQAVRRGSASELLRYDFGSDCSRDGACNRLVYGADRPPGYNLSAITTPLALFTGDRDAISPPADVALLKAALAPGVLAHHHAEPDYGHLDYELGIDTPARIYPGVVSLARTAAAAAGDISALKAPAV